MNMPQSLPLEDFKKLPLDEVFETLSEKGGKMIIRLGNGMEFVLQPNEPLEPLPILEGTMPENWKDAIYENSDG